MEWFEVVAKYGKEMSAKMAKSGYLENITLSINDDGKVDIPDRDIELAYRDIKGGKIYVAEWD